MLQKVCRDQEEQILSVLDIVNLNVKGNLTPHLTQYDNAVKFDNINQLFLVYLEQVLEAYNSVGTQSINMNEAGQSVMGRTRKNMQSMGGLVYSDNGTMVLEKSLISETPSKIIKKE